MKETTRKNVVLDKAQSRKKIVRYPIQGVSPDEKDAFVALLCKKMTHPVEFERESDLMVEKTIALLDEEIMAIENNIEPNTVNQTILGKVALRLCNEDFKAAKLYLKTGRMARKN